MIEYVYPKFHLSKEWFCCVEVNGEIVLKEAETAKWLCKEDLYSVGWMPADITLIDKINKILS